MAKNIQKPVNRHVYTPSSERTKNPTTGRTEAGDRRKARSLGFKSVKDLEEHVGRMVELNDLGVLSLLKEYSDSPEPEVCGLRALSRRLKATVGSPRQFRRMTRISYSLKSAGHA